MLHVGQGNQVLGPHLGSQSHASVRRERNVKHAGRIVQSETVGHHAMRGIQFGNLRSRRSAGLADLRISVAHINVRAIGRRGHEARAAARHKALRIGAVGEIDQGDIVRQAIGHVQHVARRVERDAGGLKSGRQGAQHLERRGVHLAYGVRPRVGHVESLPVGRHGDAPRHAAHRHAARDGTGRRIHHQDFVAAAAHHEKPFAVGRQRQIVGALIARRRRRARRTRRHRE